MELFEKYRSEFIYIIGASSLCIVIGFLIIYYLKKNKLDNLNKILGIGLFYLQLFGYVLITFGTISFVSILFAMYYSLT